MSLALILLLVSACAQAEIEEGSGPRGSQSDDDVVLVPVPTGTGTPPAPTWTPTASATASPPRPTSSPTQSPTITPSPSSTPTPTPAFATLDEFWEGLAYWSLDIFDTGLPLGESDTIYRGGDEYWSYLHASDQSAGVVDQCGDPVAFPGCTTLWKSHDGGRHFTLEEPTCLFACDSCPCDNSRDHTGQQQYPRVALHSDQLYLVYEHGAYVYIRTSGDDGATWSSAQHVPGTWIWTHPYGACGGNDVIGVHPHIYRELQYDCLVGGPPGIFIEDEILYIFVALGQAPGHMGCISGALDQEISELKPCASNPLFSADNGYGPEDVLGAEAAPYFEFRTISSADVVRVGDRYYMTYEGVRGPSSYTVVDDQFALGLARTLGPEIDGPWEKYPANPIIQPLPGNVGVGHADLVITGEITFLYTATSPDTRGRYVLLRR